MKDDQCEQTESRWQKMPVANLVRHVESGNYYARIRVRGKLIWKSLKTDRIGVAKLRLTDFQKKERQRAAVNTAVLRGKMTFGQALETYRKRLDGDYSLKERSKVYRQERIAALLKSWPELKGKDVAQISKSDCLSWASRFGQNASPSTFNNTVGTLRLVLDIPVEAGARYDNPAVDIKRKKIRQKLLHLPSHDEFLKLVETIRNADGGYGDRCADLVEFLAYSGCRKGEAARVHGRDCDFEKGELTILGDPATGTKNWEIRRVPLIPDMRRLLERIQGEREDFATNTITRVHECQGAINRACRLLSIARFTHHDLRHLFATRCIESGVDIPTVSRWLGHKDGGALAMKTYGHLRDQHSTSMAQKVIFSEPTAAAPSNIVSLPVQTAPPPSPPQDDGSDKKAIAKAKANYKYPWWASNDSLEVFWGQVNEEVRILPFEKYHEAAKAAMDRDVFPTELNDPQSLIEEFAERITPATLAKLSAKVQAGRKPAGDSLQKNSAS
jgi:integrase